MDLSLVERVKILSILPASSSFDKLTVIKDINSKVNFTQEELTKFSIAVNDEGKVTWDIKPEDNIFPIEFTKMETDLIKDQLKKLDAEEKIDDIAYMLFEKFVK